MKRIAKAHARKLQDMRRSSVAPKNKGKLYKNKEVIIIIIYFFLSLTQRQTVLHKKEYKQSVAQPKLVLVLNPLQRY